MKTGLFVDRHFLSPGWGCAVLGPPGAQAPLLAHRRVLLPTQCSWALQVGEGGLHGLAAQSLSSAALSSGCVAIAVSLDISEPRLPHL